MRYQTLTRILKKGAEYNFIMSGRSTGKSTAMGKHLIEDYKNYNHKFIRVFRRLSYMESAETWFDEFSQGGKFSEGDKIEFKDGCYYINGDLFGYTAVLSLSSRYKSTVYDSDIYNFVFDEYIEIAPDEYLDKEINKFMALISTVFRGRTGKIFCLGNNINEDSKYNPYHRYFGIDIDKQNIKQGQIKVYQSKKFDKPAKIAFEYGLIAYEQKDEIPILQRVDGNEVATSGDFAKVWNIFRQKDEYKNDISFLRDSIDNFYIADSIDKEYFAIVNDDMQSIDFVQCSKNTTISSIGKYKDDEYYNKLVTYPEIYINEMGENEYYKALEVFTPYETAVPLYDNGNRYGANCKLFLSGLNEFYNGYTFRYCDGNVKFIVENIIISQKMEV